MASTSTGSSTVTTGSSSTSTGSTHTGTGTVTNGTTVTTGSTYTGTGTITGVDISKSRDTLGDSLASANLISNTLSNSESENASMMDWRTLKQMIRVGKHLFLLGDGIASPTGKDPISRSTLQVFDITTKMFVTSQFFAGSFFANSIANNTLVSRIEKIDNEDGTVSILAITTSPITICKFTLNADGTLKSRDKYKTLTENTSYHSYSVLAANINKQFIAITVGSPNTQQYCTWIIKDNGTSFDTVTCRTDLGEILDIKVSYNYMIYALSANILRLFVLSGNTLTLKSTLNITSIGSCTGMDLGISANMAAIAVTKSADDTEVVFVNCENNSAPFVRNRLALKKGRGNTGVVKNISNMFLAIGNTSCNYISIIDIKSLASATEIKSLSFTNLGSTVGSDSILRKNLFVYENKIYFGVNSVVSWSMYENVAVFGTTISIPGSIPKGSKFKLTSHNISGKVAELQYEWSSTPGNFKHNTTLYPITTPTDISNFSFDTPDVAVGTVMYFRLFITDVNGYVKWLDSFTTIAAPIKQPATITKILCDSGNVINGAELSAGDISYLDIYFDSELASFGSKISLVSEATTVFTPKISPTNKKVLRIELPNRLNYNSNYQLVIPTQNNGGPIFSDYVPGLVENFILSFKTKQSESFNQTSNIKIVGITPENAKYKSSSKEITFMIDTIVALQNINCVLNININTADSAIYETKANVNLNTNGNYTINSGNDFIKNININGRYISFCLVAATSWNGTEIGAKITLNKKENANDKIESTFPIIYNIGNSFTGTPKIGFANNTVWNFLGEDIIVPIITPGVIISSVKTNLILLDGASGAVKAWSSVANDNNAFQIVLDSTKLAYGKNYVLTLPKGSVISSTGNTMNELILSFTTSASQDLDKPQIKPKLYGVTTANAKINEEPENNYTEVLTAKSKVFLNVMQTNGSDITEFRYAVGTGSYSEWAAISLNTDTELYVATSGEIKIQCRDAEQNESPVVSCFCKIISAIQYTVDDPEKVYTISAKKVYKPNDLFKYVDNQYNANRDENYINDIEMIIECPVKYISALKYAFNTTDTNLTNITYKSVDTLKQVNGDVSKIVLNYTPTDRVNNIRFKIKDKLGNETPVIQRIFNFDDQPPQIINFNIYDAASNLLENNSTNNAEIVIKVRATDDSLPVTVYISEDGGKTVSAPYKLSNNILNILSYTLNDQTNGAKNISIIAVDAAKNSSTQILTKTFSFNKKTIWGTLSIENAASATNKTAVSAVITSSAAVKYKLSRTKEELISGTLEYTEFANSVKIDDIDISDAAEGSITKLYALISDAAGNTSIIEDGILIKRTLAQQSFKILEGTKTKNKTITLEFATTDDIKYYKVNNNGKRDLVYTPMPDTKTTTIELSEGDGNKVIGVIFKDDIGNIKDEIKNTIVLDTTPPRVKLVSKSGYNITNDVTFNVVVEHILDDSLDYAKDIKFSINDGEYSQSWQPLNKDSENLFTLPFNPEDKQSFKINAKVRDEIGNISTEEISLTFTYDAEPVKVVSGINTTNLSKTEPLKILFDKELDSATVNVNNVKIQKLYSENNEVAYMPFVASNKKVMVINATFEYFTMYKLTITANIKDIAGNFLEKEYSVIFQTEVDPILTIVSTSVDGEPTDVRADSDFTITFGWPMNFSTTNSSNITLIANYNGELIPCVIKRGINNYQVKVVPEEELENGVTYTLLINDNVKNEKGSSFEAGTVKSYKFKTEYIEPLVIFQSPYKNFLTYKEGKFIKITETNLTQNLIKKYGISVNQLSTITTAAIQTLEEETKVIILANEQYTSMECYATKQKTSDIEYAMENIEPNLVHNNFFWSVQNENDEVEYVIKDNKTIVFEVPKLNSDGESTINKELKVLCKIKK